MRNKIETINGTGLEIEVESNTRTVLEQDQRVGEGEDQEP